MLKIKHYLAKSKLRSASILLILMLFSWYCFFGWKYSFIYTIGESMEPTYKDGEMVIVQNIRTLGKDWLPSRWDVLIIRDKAESENLSKRVVGLEGETVEIKSGYIYINDKKTHDPYGRGERISFLLVDDNYEKLHVWGTDEQAVEYADDNKLTIPKGYVWVIGDNRSVSWYGLLPIKDIKSLVIF